MLKIMTKMMFLYCITLCRYQELLKKIDNLRCLVFRLIISLL